MDWVIILSEIGAAINCKIKIQITALNVTGIIKFVGIFAVTIEYKTISNPVKMFAILPAS